MKLHILTQDQENYGTDEQPYWKFKGGEDFFVLMGTSNGNVHALVESLRPRIEHDTPYFRRAIIGFEVVADDYLTDFEQSQLEYDGKIVYPTTVIDLSETA